MFFCPYSAYFAISLDDKLKKSEKVKDRNKLQIVDEAQKFANWPFLMSSLFTKTFFN